MADTLADEGDDILIYEISLSGRLTQQTGVGAKTDFFDSINNFTVPGVCRVQQVIDFLRDDDTGNSQQHRFSLIQPLITDVSGG